MATAASDSAGESDAVDRIGNDDGNGGGGGDPSSL